MQILEHVIGKYFLLFEHLIGLAWGVHYLFGTQMFAQNLNDTYPRSRKGKLHKIMEIIYFSAGVRQCNIAYSVAHVQL